MCGRSGGAGAHSLVVVVLTMLAACAAPSSGGPAPTQASPAEWDRLPDGAHSGFVDGIEGDALTFRPAEMLSDDGAPNGFRIEAADADELLLRVAPSATGALIDDVAIDQREVDLATLVAFVGGDAPSWAYGSRDFFYVAIEVQDGEVLRIEEVYLP